MKRKQIEKYYERFLVARLANSFAHSVNEKFYGKPRKDERKWYQKLMDKLRGEISDFRIHIGERIAGQRFIDYEDY